MRILYLLIAFIAQVHILFSIQGQSSYPYISGYTWAFFCDWRLLDHDYGSTPENFSPERVKTGDTVFVDYICLEEFARDYLPKIQSKIILITANYGYGADNSMPGPYDYLLKEEKVAAWFVQNIDRESTEKLKAIPLGLASRHWPHGDTHLLDQWIPISLAKKQKSIFMYLNFTPRPQRVDCIEYFQKVGAKFESEKPFEHYLSDLSESVFVISPPGNGIDCHRTWEALLMGCYPIVKNSTLTPLYEDLPVVVIRDWSEVTEEFLQRKLSELKGKTWSREKLYAPYWFRKIRDMQEKLRAKVSYEAAFDPDPCPCNETGALFKSFYETYLDRAAIQHDYLIPPLIHFIWLGSEIPSKVLHIVESWKKWHPEWTVKIWTDLDAASFGLQNQRAFDSARNLGEKSDILRYEILYRFGGIYADIDFECLQPFDNLHKSCAFYAGINRDNHWLLNGLIGASPKHPILKACIDHLRVTKGDHDAERIMQQTGPYFFTRMFFTTAFSCELGTIALLPPTFFYPFPAVLRYSMNAEEAKQRFVKPESLCIHYWSSSWQQADY